MTNTQSATVKRNVNGLVAGQKVDVRYAGFYDSYNVYVAGEHHSSLHEEYFTSIGDK